MFANNSFSSSVGGGGAGRPRPGSASSVRPNLIKPQTPLNPFKPGGNNSSVFSPQRGVNRSFAPSNDVSAISRPSSAFRPSAASESTKALNNSKLVELSAKVGDLDKDIENQSIVRRSRDGRIEELSNQVGNLTNMSKTMEFRMDNNEERLQRLERLVQSEKDNRENMDKALRRLIDEKIGDAMMQHSSDKLDSDTQAKDLKMKVMELENRMGEVGGSDSVIKEKIHNLEVFTDRISDKVNSLQSELQTEALKRTEDIQTAFKNLKNSVAHMQTTVDGERSARERNAEAMKELFHAEKEDMKFILSQEARDIHTEMKKLQKALGNEQAALKGQLELESKSRANDMEHLMEKMNGLMNDLSTAMERQQRTMAEENFQRFKNIDDKLWTMNYTLEKETEARVQGDRSLHENLTEEKNTRESEQRMTSQVMESTMEKLQQAMDHIFRAH